MMAGPIAEAYVELLIDDKQLIKDAKTAFGKIEVEGDTAAQQVESAFATAGTSIKSALTNVAGTVFGKIKSEGKDAAQSFETAFSDAGVTAFDKIELGSKTAAQQVETEFKVAGDAIELEMAQAASASEAELKDIQGPDLKSEGKESGDSFLSGFSKIKSGATAIGTAAGTALAAGFKGVLNREESAASFQATFGMTEEESRIAGIIAGKAYQSAWGESLEDTTNLTGAILQNLARDLDPLGGEVSDLVSRAFALEQAFGIDAQELVNSASIAISSGLAKDGAEALDLLTGSFQNLGPAVRDEVVAATNEYSKSFAQLGISGPAAFGLLTKAGEQGIIGITMSGDAIKEFTIRATDGSAASLEAFKAIGLSGDEMANRFLAGGDIAGAAFEEVVAGLLAIEDPAEQAQTAIGLFGTPLEDLGTDRIPDFLTALGGAGEELGDFQGSAQGVADILGGTTQATFEAFKREALGTLTDFVADKVLPVMARLKDFFLEDVVPILSRVWAVWQPVLKDIADLASQVFDILFKRDFTRGPLSEDSKVVGVLFKIRDAMVEVINYVVRSWPKVEAALVVVFDYLQEVALPIAIEVFGGIVKVVKSVADFFVRNWPLALGAVKSVFNFILDNRDPILAALGALAILQAGALAASFYVAAAGAIALAIPIIATYLPAIALAAAFAALAAAAVYAYQNFDVFREAVDSAVSFLIDTAWPIIKEVAAGIVTAFSAVTDWFVKVWPTIQKAIFDTVGWLIEYVLPVILSFVDLTIAYFQRLWKVASKIFTVGLDLLIGIVTFAIDAIQVIWDLFGKTILNYITVVWDNIKTVIEVALKIVRGVIDTVTGLISGDWGKVWDGIKTILSGVWDGIKAIIDIALDAIKFALQLALDLLTGIWETSWNAISGFFGGIWDGMTTYVSDKWNEIVGFVETGINNLMGFITAIPGRIADGVLGAFDSLKNGFASAVNWIIDKWNGIGFTLPKFEIDVPLDGRGPYKFGGQTFGSIKIPRIELANGALVTSPTLALVGEAGPELVLPLNRPERARQLLNEAGIGGGGAVVSIGTANFYDGTDADLVAQKTMLALSARRLTA